MHTVVFNKDLFLYALFSYWLFAMRMYTLSAETSNKPSDVSHVNFWSDLVWSHQGSEGWHLWWWYQQCFLLHESTTSPECLCYFESFQSCLRRMSDSRSFLAVLPQGLFGYPQGHTTSPLGFNCAAQNTFSSMKHILLHTSPLYQCPLCGPTELT